MTDQERKIELKKMLVEGLQEAENTIPSLEKYLETTAIMIEENIETADFFVDFYDNRIKKDEDVIKNSDIMKGATAYHNINLAYLTNRIKDLNLKADVLMEVIEEKRNENVDNS